MSQVNSHWENIMSSNVKHTRAWPTVSLKYVFIGSKKTQKRDGHVSRDVYTLYSIHNLMKTYLRLNSE